MENYKISCIKHSDLADVLLEKIIHLKQQSWSYSSDSHREWINKNLSSKDYHLCIEDEEFNLIGYLNLTNVYIDIDNIQVKVLGIGNVCIDINQRGNGMGALLIAVSNMYIKKINKLAILLCKKELIPFYSKAGWFLFKGESVRIGSSNYQGELMFNNNNYIMTKSIIINKSF